MLPTALWRSFRFGLQHLRPACSSPSPSQPSCLGGDPVSPREELPHPGLAPLMLMWTQTGWRWARGSILVYFQLLMTSLSLQYASTTASLKKASTTWSSICKCQSQGPLALCHSQHGALSLLRFRKSSVPTSGHSLSALLQGVTSFQTYPACPPLTWLCAGFYP